MNYIVRLTKALNKLGLKKEAQEILKLAGDPRAYNKIRSNISQLEFLMTLISNSISDYLEYKKSDPDDVFLSEEELEKEFRDIFQRCGRAMTLIEEAFSLTGHIGWGREPLIRSTRIFLRKIESEFGRFYGLIATKVYKTTPTLGIKKVHLLYWRMKLGSLSERCREFLQSGEPDFIEEEMPRASRFTFDPARERTIADIEKTETGEEEGTSIEISLPTSS